MSLSTAVDSASPGSHETASFSWAPVSLSAGEKATTKATTQKARITHFVFRPEAKRAKGPTVLLVGSLTRSTFPGCRGWVNRLL